MGTASCIKGWQQVYSERGLWYVAVAWEDAESLRYRLKRCGLSTTLCLNPQTREARLELWPGVDLDRVLAELDAARSERRRRPARVVAA